MVRGVDVWAFGVTAYVLLAGEMPFYDECFERTKDKIVAGWYPRLQGHSKAVTDLISLCLNKKAEQVSFLPSP